MKKMILLLVLISTFVSCNKELDLEDYKTAVMLSIENSMQVAKFGDVKNKKEIKATCILLPINQKLIETAVEYKSVLDGLSKSEKEKLLHENITKFINGEHAVFALFFINEIEDDNNDYIGFKDSLRGNVELRDDNSEYKLLGYTPGFNHNFMNGITKGYLIFENFRKNAPYSYSIILSNLMFCIDKDKNDPLTKKWPASFDNTELEIMSLIEQGLEEKDIRDKLGINTKMRFDISNSDLDNILNVALTIVSTGIDIVL